jgi:hypothetical protein
MGELDRIKKELKRKKTTLKQLEGVYRTSTNVSQRSRVSKEIEAVKESIKNLRGKLVIYGFEHEFVEDGEETTDIKDVKTSILDEISVPPFRKESRDKEIDAVVSYIRFFEENYLSILSEYYIKLDFNHSIKRDTFYPRFMEIKKILKEYNYELDILSREEFNNIAFYRDKSVVYKIRQRYFIALDGYFKDLRNFLEILVDDYRTNGNIVLNPDDILGFSDFEANHRLNGITVIDSLNEIFIFTSEFLRFLGMPKL